MLNNLHAAQQALELAETPNDVTQALQHLLVSHIEGAIFDIVLETNGTEIKQPTIDAKGLKITVPLVVGINVYGHVTGKNSEAFTQSELAIILAQSTIAAIRLDRLSWPASPLVFHQLAEIGRAHV